jgi:radical SAM superfamily enzyme YgiQ (UPF0313 family)/DNA-binding protein Fis
MPLGIGLLGSHLKSKVVNIDVELFKYPHDLAYNLESREPSILGFANYSWNFELSYEIARRVKKQYPKTVIVFGGPNYGLTTKEVDSFWDEYELIDFYIVLEGEKAFTRLVERLQATNFDLQVCKAEPELLMNCHYLHGGKVVRTIAERLSELDSTPSPYIEGLMDKFFDNKLIPLTHTTRGCPFTCTFCTEGSKYYQKVAQRTKLEDELRYIAERRGVIPDLALSDANFGMFLQDKAKAQVIKKIKDEFGWPKRLVVSTGKNQKERILEVASILEGSLSVAASLQSTNTDILENIKRSNISLETLRAVVDGAKTADSPTYTEIILNLPGDTVQKHKKSIEDVINLGLGVVRMYQLILLPQTELNTPETRDLYKMKSKFRINPRSFGTYELFGESFVVTEMEEIVVETDTMSFEDYLSCRKLNLSVEIVHNTGFFYELAALFRQLGYSWFSLIETFNSIHSEGAIDEISELYLNYEKENLSGLFDTQEAVRIEMQSNIKKYLEDLDGTNEIAKAKAQAVKNHFSAIHKLVFLIARELLLDQSCTDIPLLSAYLDDLERYSLAKKADFLNIRDVQVEGLRFDFMSFEQDGFDEVRLELESEKSVLLRHDSEQVQLIKSYTSQYDGNTIDGIGRILMRSNPRKLLRKIVSHSNSVETKPADFEGVRVNAYGGFTVE